MKVQILDEAMRDEENGFRFYEAQEAGLGDYFLDSLFSDIDSLQLYGGVHAVRLGYHRLLADRFPYAVYYLVEDDIVRVRAVVDCRRNPDSILKKLRHLGPSKTRSGRRTSEK